MLLHTHWVLVVMDQFTRRIIGFGVHAGDVDGVALCRMFNRAISGQGEPPYLSSDQSHCSNITDGRGTFAYWMSRRSRSSRTRPYHIRLWNG